MDFVFALRNYLEVESGHWGVRQVVGSFETSANEGVREILEKSFIKILGHQIWIQQEVKNRLSFLNENLPKLKKLEIENSPNQR